MEGSLPKDGDPIDQKTAIELYKIVIGYLQYENVTFHVRNAFFMTISIALAAYVGGKLSAMTEFRQSVAVASTSFFAAAFGLWFSLIWRGTLSTVHDVWINRWQSLLVRLEQTTFGADFEMFRNLPTSANHPMHANIRVLLDISTAFLAGWIVAFAAELVLLINAVSSD